MTEANDPAPAVQPQGEVVPPPPPPPPAGGAVPAPVYTGGAPATAPIGQIRSTGTSIVLFIVTLGIYGWIWYFKSHEEMKAHSGTGLGGPVALILAIFVGIVLPFLTPHEVGGLYERRGQAQPVSAVTGLWILLPLIGP